MFTTALASTQTTAAHCRQICQQWQVPLVVHHVTLARGGLGVEAHARAARYQAFQDTLNAGEVLVTAQHRDDRAKPCCWR